MKSLWWERNDLAYNDKGRLNFAGRDVQQLAEKAGNPAFFYSAARVRDNLNRVLDGLSRAGVKGRVFYAVKANRFAPLLTYLKTRGTCGVDVCSPEEVRHAISCGFDEEDISYTGTSVSNRDLDILVSYPGITLNCDGLSMIRRLGERVQGRKIGLRINPAMGTGYGSNELLRYSGDKPTKFGIYASEFEAALKLAAEYKVTISNIHFHTGCGYLNEQLDVWEKILIECRSFITRIPTVTSINLGGGLGVPLTREDGTLDMEQWSAVIQKVFGGDSYEVAVEPGTYLVKDAGVLVLEANTVETKSGRNFIGVNGGFNLAMEPAHYKLPCEPTPCIFTDKKEEYFAEDALVSATVAGNINEALDVWVEDLPMPEIAEGSLLAFVNAGAYTMSMSSNHCMRGAFSQYLLL